MQTIRFPSVLGSIMSVFLLAGAGCESSKSRVAGNPGGSRGQGTSGGATTSGGTTAFSSSSGGGTGGNTSSDVNSGSYDAGLSLADSGTGDAGKADKVSLDAGSIDLGAPDLPTKPPLDAANPDLDKGRVDAFISDALKDCNLGDKRCAGLFVETCSETGRWRTSETCLYLCSAGACGGECFPGSLRCRPGTGAATPQLCIAQGAWEDQAACPDSTPTCFGGRCFASCLQAGNDCTDPQTACCPGSECVSTDGSLRKNFACKAIPACAALGGTCTATTDCCAGLDCTGGKCAARNLTCMEQQIDGVCGDASGAVCCPGTTCSSDFGHEPSEKRCGRPGTTFPQDESCPRDQPYQHEECSAARVGMRCHYEDWVKKPGYYYDCLCNYHGWACEEGRRVHGLNPADRTP